MAMPVMDQFAYGPINPIVAYFCSFTGSLLGLLSTARARRATGRGRRARWLVLAAVAIGGPGIWLMHFMAMIGFDVPATSVRYNVALTVASLGIAILVVAAGLFIAGFGDPTVLKTIFGGVFTGTGIAAMHYTGMAAMNLQGSITYVPNVVAASVLIAIVAATVALWFTVTVRGSGAVVAAAAVMAVAICGMHYTGMAALRVHLNPADGIVSGVSPLVFVVPIAVLTSVTIIAIIFASLTMTATEDFNLDPTISLPTVTARHTARFAKTRH